MNENDKEGKKCKFLRKWKVEKRHWPSPSKCPTEGRTHRWGCGAERPRDSRQGDSRPPPHPHRWPARFLGARPLLSPSCSVGRGLPGAEWWVTPAGLSGRPNKRSSPFLPFCIQPEPLVPNPPPPPPTRGSKLHSIWMATLDLGGVVAAP